MDKPTGVQRAKITAALVKLAEATKCIDDPELARRVEDTMKGLNEYAHRRPRGQANV